MIATVEEWSRVLSTLGSIMYSRDCPLHAELVLWAEQLEKLATNYPNSTCFCEYLNNIDCQKQRCGALEIETSPMHVKTPM
jgi:hypothetical protein